jgi:hypothetical protein
MADLGRRLKFSLQEVISTAYATLSASLDLSGQSN